MGTIGKVLVVLLFIGLAASGFGPTWVVDSTHITSGRHIAVCHEKFHSEHTKQVTVPAGGQLPRVGSACPNG